MKCLLYEARNNVAVQEAEETRFKDTLREINPKMGLANVSSNHDNLVDTKYGKSPVGSFSSYQLSHTESNFDVYINVEPAAQRIDTDTNNPQINQFPRFPLQNQGESEERNLSDDKKEFVNRLKLDGDEINALEGATRYHASIVSCGDPNVDSGLQLQIFT